MDNLPSKIVLFDGVCNFCNSTISFMIKRDKKKIFRYTPLQSKIAQHLLKKHNLLDEGIDSIIYIKNGEAFVKSSAALLMCKQLSGLWPVFYSLIVIPRVIRDFFYDIIARNRYRWFGKRDACMVPTAEVKELFLE
ncbi:MAG: thiol-disulfide oxidoreductase [Flavobacteriales bacterium]|nr:MAG: thiol-disulfide oxidoreductase [Flavobacteriales bacterium]